MQPCSNPPIKKSLGFDCKLVILEQKASTVCVIIFFFFGSAVKAWPGSRGVVDGIFMLKRDTKDLKFWLN